jgi:formylglycine-generating enzyme required for sulfatase activity
VYGFGTRWSTKFQKKHGIGKRPYPWPTDKGEPSPNLANFGQNVGATTSVGQYPEGTAPEGLIDMAGNAWEWMENYYDEDKDLISSVPLGL